MQTWCCYINLPSPVCYTVLTPSVTSLLHTVLIPPSPVCYTVLTSPPITSPLHTVLAPSSQQPVTSSCQTCRCSAPDTHTSGLITTVSMSFTQHSRYPTFIFSSFLTLVSIPVYSGLLSFISRPPPGLLSPDCSSSSRRGQEGRLRHLVCTTQYNVYLMLGLWWRHYLTIAHIHFSCYIFFDFFPLLPLA